MEENKSPISIVASRIRSSTTYQGFITIAPMIAAIPIVYFGWAVPMGIIYFIGEIILPNSLQSLLTSFLSVFSIFFGLVWITLTERYVYRKM